MSPSNDDQASVRAINDALLNCPMPDRLAALACAIISDEPKACYVICDLISVAGVLARKLPAAERLAIAWHMLEEIETIGEVELSREGEVAKSGGPPPTDRAKAKA